MQRSGVPQLSVPVTHTRFIGYDPVQHPEVVSHHKRPGTLWELNPRRSTLPSPKRASKRSPVPCLKELDQFIMGFESVDASFARAHKIEEIGVKMWGRATSAFGPGDQMQ